MIQNVRSSLAKRISQFFSPLIWVNFGIWLLLWQAYLDNHLLFWQTACLVVVFTFCPVAFFFLGAKHGRFDLDMTKREERFRFYVFGLLCGFLGLNLVYYFSFDLFRIFLTVTIDALVFAVITLWDKPSLHVGGLTSAFLIVNLLSGWHYFYLFPIIPLVAWSRVVLEKHSLSEILEGFLIPILTIPTGFFLLKIG